MRDIDRRNQVLSYKTAGSRSKVEGVGSTQRGEPYYQVNVWVTLICIVVENLTQVTGNHRWKEKRVCQ
jgi:hypothetical protein